MTQRQFSSIILAGGKGRRLNGQDKGLIHYRGAPLIHYAFQSAQACSSRTLISANRNIEYYQTLGVEVVSDSTPNFGGPLCGLSACAPLISSKFTLVIACDMPGLSHAIISALQENLVSNVDSFDAAVYEHHGRLECGLMALQTSTIKALAEQQQFRDQSIKGWLKSLRLSTLKIPSNQAFTNLNRPLDF
ncbi:MAG: molybdenum cofactor guanylyltransferase [Pseudomonadales bacterium]